MPASIAVVDVGNPVFKLKHHARVGKFDNFAVGQLGFEQHLRVLFYRI